LVPELELNAAETFLSELRVRLQLLPEAESQPDQPAKTDPLAATAVRVTEVPGGSVALQVAPQLIPLPVTVPEPEPDLATVTVWKPPELLALNVAETLRFEASARVHVFPEAESQPDQLAKVEPVAAVAVRVTAVPAAKLSLQTEPQFTPLPVTVPEPEPAVETLRR